MCPSINFALALYVQALMYSLTLKFTTSQYLTHLGQKQERKLLTLRRYITGSTQIKKLHLR